MSNSATLDVTVLRDNNKLGCLYTDIPAYSFMAIIGYLEPKAKAWNSGNTKELNIVGNSTYVLGMFLVCLLYCKPVVFSTYSTQAWFACCRCLCTI